MKLTILLGLLLPNVIFAQIYGSKNLNEGPDHGKGESFNAFDWNDQPYVRSELTINGKTYSYIRTGDYDFKLSRKDGDQFTDIIRKLHTTTSGAMGENSRLLHIYEDDKIINIYSWGLAGYDFVFYQKSSQTEPKLVRCGNIQNLEHTLIGFDKSIRALEFTGGNKLKITREPTRRYPEAESTYEFRPGGVYLNGQFTLAVQDYEPEEVFKANLLRDPNFYHDRNEAIKARNAQYELDKQQTQAATAPPNQEGSPASQPSRPIETESTETAPAAIQKADAPISTPEPSPWLMRIILLLSGLLTAGLIYRKLKQRASLW